MNPFRHSLGHRDAALARGPGLLAKAAAIAVGMVVLVAGLVFSAVLVAAMLVAGVGVGGYLWFKTRGLRRELRAEIRRAQSQDRSQGRASPRAGGTVLEGDYIREAQQQGQHDERGSSAR